MKINSKNFNNKVKKYDSEVIYTLKNFNIKINLMESVYDQYSKAMK